MKLLDLCCKAGGAAMGYKRAAEAVGVPIEIVGVDIEAQSHYPFTFIKGDALTFPLDGFDAIHASPPCQRFSVMTKRWNRSEEHPDLIPPLRKRLIEANIPYIIENVMGAPLITPVTLCGSMFGLPLRRHRLFETSFPILGMKCNHSGPIVGVYGHAGGHSKRDGLTFGGTESWRKAMQIDWMVGDELAEAIPPAYTEYIGRQLLLALIGA